MEGFKKMKCYAVINRQDNYTLAQSMQALSANVVLNDEPISPVLEFHFGDSDPEDDHDDVGGDHPILDTWLYLGG